jgi:hypothetical protein
MNLIERAKNMLINPKAEWAKAETEQNTLGGLFTSYVLPLLIIPTVAAFVGMSFIGYTILMFVIKGVELGIRYAIIVAASTIVTYFVSAIIINALAPTFKGQKNQDQAAKLSAYSMTAVCVAGIFFIIPSLYALALIGSMYSFYIMYTGMARTMKVPEDQVIGYVVISALAMVLVYFISLELFSEILIRSGYTTTLH